MYLASNVSIHRLDIKQEKKLHQICWKYLNLMCFFFSSNKCVFSSHPFIFSYFSIYFSLWEKYLIIYGVSKIYLCFSKQKAWSFYTWSTFKIQNQNSKHLKILRTFFKTMCTTHIFSYNHGFFNLSDNRPVLLSLRERVAI